jgi:hypothetical protein
MQERFLERAASAGIPVSRFTSTLFDPQFSRIAMIAVLLAISISLSWKVFSVPNARRETPDYYTFTTQPAPTSDSTAHAEAERTARVFVDKQGSTQKEINCAA